MLHAELMQIVGGSKKHFVKKICR